VELRNQGGASKNTSPARMTNAPRSPKQDAMLVGSWNSKATGNTNAKTKTLSTSQRFFN
jgi:hypothetical protein